ncbi:uncharacterized protein [Chironomus tepperi]|uniref:uncharacterized protein n=1 Tax=Chironomus tepperi TaxID=113505 RepID=UPI00391EE583
MLIVALTITSNSENFAPYSFGVEKETCKKYWWMALTFNFMDAKQIYAAFIWFVSVYLQLTLAAPFVFWAIKHEKFGNYIKALVLLASTVIRFYHTYDGYYYMLFTDKGFDTYHDEIFIKYIAACYRLLPFFGGFILEQFLTKDSKVKDFITVIPTFILFFIHSLSFFTCGKMQISILASTFDIFTIYSLLILLNSCYHSDGTIKKFLSSDFWTPISKMGFSIYLMSAYIQFTIYERQLEPIEIRNELDFILIFLMDILKISIPILLTFLFVEEPFSRLGELMAGKLQPSVT